MVLTLTYLINSTPMRNNPMRIYAFKNQQLMRREKREFEEKDVSIQYILNAGQISIDLGSSQYAISTKSNAGDETVIDLGGNQAPKKVDSAACVVLQDAINSEKIDPAQIKFGQLANDAKNVALFLNWKNYFFESVAKIHYPDCPTIPSNSSRSARIWVSSLFEAFLYYSIIAGLNKIGNQNMQALFITLLIPSVDEKVHREYLYSCFESALEKVIMRKRGQNKQYEQINYFFQLKSEAVAAVVSALSLNKNLCNQDFLLADLGGFTSDFAVVKYIENEKKIKICHSALNIAGNSIDIVRKILITNQLADISITNQYQLHEIVRKCKETDNNQVTISATQQFCDTAYLVAFVLNTIYQGMWKLKELLKGAVAIDKLNSLAKYIYPFIQENIDSCFLQPQYYNNSELENLKNKFLKIQGVQVSFQSATEADIMIWIFDNLKAEAKQQVVRSFVSYHTELMRNSLFLQKKPDMELELSKILKKNGAQETTKDCDPRVCKEIQAAMPLFSSYAQFEQFLKTKQGDNEREQGEANSEATAHKNDYQKIQQFMENQMYSDLWNSIRLNVVEKIDDQEIKQYCGANQISEITQSKFKKYKNVKQLDERQKKLFVELESQIEITKDVLSQQQLIFQLSGIQQCNFIETYKKFCENCKYKYEKYKAFDTILLTVIQNEENNALKQKFIQQLFSFHDCKYLFQLLKNLALSQIVQLYLIKSIQLKEFPVFTFHENILQNTTNVVTDKITEKIRQQSLGVQSVVLSGGFSQQDNFKQLDHDLGIPILRLQPVDLVKGGIISRISQEIVEQKADGVNDSVVDQFAFKFDEGIQLEALKLSQFKFNRLNIDQGTNGSQGYCSWANDTFTTYLNSGQELLGDSDKKRADGNSAATKMPSFVIFNITKLKEFAKQFGEKYLSKSGDLIPEAISNILIEQQLSNKQLAEILSFESYSSNALLVEGKKEKSKLTKKSKVSNILDMIYSWKRKLYDEAQPKFPDWPIIKSSTECEIEPSKFVKYEIDIPLSQIYISQLLYFKHKYNNLYDDPKKLANAIAVTMTVPCGANANHLHFIRCCCKAAGFGDNISFIFEPVSAFAHIFYSKTQSQLKGADNSQSLKEGQYLVIDVGGGTTDLAYITVRYQKRISGADQFNREEDVVPELELNNYYSILKAGNAIDTQFQQRIELDKTFDRKDLSKQGYLQLMSKFDTMKTSKDELFSFEVEVANKANVKIVDNKSLIINPKFNTDNEKMLSFTVESKYIKESIKKISDEIIDEVKEFAQHAKIDLNDTFIVCVGGIGGSPLFVNIAKQRLFSTPLEAEYRLIDVEECVAQISISKGGVYLAEEKDHVNFNANVTKIYKSDLTMDDNPQLVNVEMTWQLEECKFFVRDKQNLLQRGAKPFFQGFKTTEARYLQCSCGQFGIPIQILLKKGQNEKLGGIIFFPIETLNDRELDGEKFYVPQHKYIGCLSVSPPDPKLKLNPKTTVTVSCRLILKGYNVNQAFEQAIHIDVVAALK